MFFFFFEPENNPKIEGFKILNLDLRNNKYLGNQRFQFVSENETNTELYSTIIIGPNGTGKSFVLRTILDIFREIDNWKVNNKRQTQVSGEYSITYSINGKLFQFGNLQYFENADWKDKESRSTLFEARIDGLPANISDLLIPESIIANSIMLTDKFPIVKDSFDNYIYLGVRRESSPSVAGTRTYVTRTVDYAVNSINQPGFEEKIKKTLDFLDLDKEFTIQFTPKYKHLFFNGSVTPDFFYQFHDQYWKYTRRNEGSPPWSKRYFDKQIRENETLVSDLAALCNKISRNLESAAPKSRSKFFKYNLFSASLSSKDYLLVKELRSLDLLSYPSIKLKKSSRKFELEESSSGEAHFLSSIIALIANVKNNSLVLIDEPEISLHPNWQKKYMGFLQEIFSEYKSCHFIIATHSHFLISDLKPKTSAIIGLSRDIEIKNQFIDLNTFGWSAEEVLFKIFGVKTSRNYYIEINLRELLSLISGNSKDKIKMESLLDNFSFLNLNQEDPLKQILIEAKNYINTL
jgi:predicted ATP-binding protein involved in virulence